MGKFTNCLVCGNKLNTNDDVFCSTKCREKSGIRIYNSFIKAYQELLTKEKLTEKELTSLNEEIYRFDDNEDIEKLNDYVHKKIIDYGFKFSLEDVEKRAKEIKEDKDEETEKRVLKKKFDNHKNIISNYEFNPYNVVKRKPFPILKLNENLFGYGFLLPKYQERTNKKGEVTHREQIRFPVIIGSDNKLYEINKRFEEDYKIGFNEVPTELELRWDLRSIEKWIKEEEDYQIVEGRELFDKIKNLYKKYLYFQNEIWYSIHSLWDIGTYVFMLFKCYPIFELRGVRGTGKTKIMTISNGLSFNASNEIMVNPSESSLFRETHSKRITKYIDEAEKLYQIVKGKMIADDRITFINQSYFHKGGVPRQEKVGNKFKTIYYQSYSPTMIGSINGLYEATENRAIVHIMTKNPKEDDRGDLEPDTESKEFQEIRNELYLFALQNWSDIELCYNQLENKTEMKSRDFQIWKPLLSIAMIINNGLYEDTKESAEELTKVKEESISEDSMEYNILKTMGELIIRNEYYQNSILIKDILKNYPDTDYKPKNRTIGRALDRLGFMEVKKHTNNGWGYNVNKKMFHKIVLTLNSSLLLSLSSLSSLIEENSNNNSDNIVTEVTEEIKESDNSAKNDKSDEGMVKEGFLNFIKNNPNCSFEDIQKGLEIDEKVLNKSLNEALKKGDIVEIKPDRYKVLE